MQIINRLFGAFHSFFYSHEELKLLSSVNTTTHADGWVELNVTYALKEWIEDKDNNMGLVIKANLNEKPDKELLLNDVGFVSSRGDDEFQPFMVGFFTGQEVNKNFNFGELLRIKNIFSDDSTKSRKTEASSS